MTEPHGSALDPQPGDARPTSAYVATSTPEQRTAADAHSVFYAAFFGVLGAITLLACARALYHRALRREYEARQRRKVDAGAYRSLP